MRKRTVLNVTCVLLISWALLECASLLAFKPMTGMAFSLNGTASVRKERLDLIARELGVLGTGNQALYDFHPYVGYVGKPGAFPWGPDKTAFNEFGMLSALQHSYPYTKKNNEFVVAVVGGSVAEMFANGEETRFDAFMRDRLGFDRKVVFINLATGGYKQPQQLFHIQYALLAGFELDAVLNIDGFNEIALASQNIRDGANPLFPSLSHMALMAQLSGTDLPGPELAKLVAAYYRTYEAERALLEWIEGGMVKYSVFMNLLGQTWITRSRNRIEAIKYRSAAVAKETAAGTFSGPAFEAGADGYGAATDIWRRSSEMLASICWQNGLIYLHVLQPNQYLEGSKKLTEQERQKAINPDNPWGASAREGYGGLIAAGRRLRENNIPFHDLTMIFRDVGREIYIDDCCHINPYGNLLLGREIARLLLAELRQRQGAGSGGV